MSIDRVRRGGRASAAGQNQLIDRLNALSSPGAGDEAQYGASGITFRGVAATHLGIFELQAGLQYPDLNSPAAAPTDHFDRDPCAFAQANMIWCSHMQAADEDSSGNPIRSYGGADFSKTVLVYHPTARTNPAGYAYGTPSLSPGQRVYCIWNPQSGRWEIIAPALNIWRIMFNQTYAPGFDHATAYLVDDQNYDAANMANSQQITVYFPDTFWAGVAKGASLSGENLAAAGTLAYAIWSPLRQRWEVLNGHFKLVFEAEAYQTIPTGGKGLVTLYWLDPAGSGTLVNSGLQVAAWNWLLPEIVSGEKCTVAYDRTENRWIILASDQTTRQQTLDVVNVRYGNLERFGVERPLHDAEHPIAAVDDDRRAGEPLVES